jgi:hypothetical protein
MRTRLLLIVGIFTLPFGIGCETPPSYSAQMWGTSTANARKQMLAKRPEQPQPGLDGTTANLVFQNYIYYQDPANRRLLMMEMGLVDLD